MIIFRTFLVTSSLFLSGCAGFDAAAVFKTPYGDLTYSMPKPAGVVAGFAK